MRGVCRVKNKNYAPIQITAEQIVREARELEKSEIHRHRSPKHKINDETELGEYRQRKRKEFEDLIRRVGSNNVKVWIKYADWEQSQKEFDRCPVTGRDGGAKNVTLAIFFGRDNQSFEKTRLGFAIAFQFTESSFRFQSHHIVTMFGTVIFDNCLA